MGAGWGQGEVGEKDEQALLLSRSNSPVARGRDREISGQCWKFCFFGSEPKIHSFFWLPKRVNRDISCIATKVRKWLNFLNCNKRLEYISSFLCFLCFFIYLLFSSPLWFLFSPLFSFLSLSPLFSFHSLSPLFSFLSLSPLFISFFFVFFGS